MQYIIEHFEMEKDLAYITICFSLIYYQEKYCQCTNY